MARVLSAQRQESRRLGHLPWTAAQAWQHRTRQSALRLGPVLQCHAPGASSRCPVRHSWNGYLVGSGDREIRKHCSAVPLQDTVVLVATTSLLRRDRLLQLG